MANQDAIEITGGMHVEFKPTSTTIISDKSEGSLRAGNTENLS